MRARVGRSRDRVLLFCAVLLHKETVRHELGRPVSGGRGWLVQRGNGPRRAKRADPVTLKLPRSTKELSLSRNVEGVMASTISSPGDRPREELELVARVGLGHFGIGRCPLADDCRHRPRQSEWTAGVGGSLLRQGLAGCGSYTLRPLPLAS